MRARAADSALAMANGRQIFLLVLHSANLLTVLSFQGPMLSNFPHYTLKYPVHRYIWGGFRSAAGRYLFMCHRDNKIAESTCTASTPAAGHAKIISLAPDRTPIYDCYEDERNAGSKAFPQVFARVTQTTHWQPRHYKTHTSAHMCSTE